MISSMKSQETAPSQMPEWGKLIYDARTKLGENQTVFGRRFGVSHATVSDWERGVIDPPGRVTWWLTRAK